MPTYCVGEAKQGRFGSAPGGVTGDAAARGSPLSSPARAGSGGDARRRGSPAPGTLAPLFPRGSGPSSALLYHPALPAAGPDSGGRARGGPGAGWPRGGARAVPAAPGAVRRLATRRVPMALQAEAARLDGGWQEVSEPRRYRVPRGKPLSPFPGPCPRPHRARPFSPIPSSACPGRPFPCPASLSVLCPLPAGAGGLGPAPGLSSPPPPGPRHRTPAPVGGSPVRGCPQSGWRVCGAVSC